ncbi:MAG: Uncharacterised protein [Opitutia bacterium UBA7350]|nr:MAG: Uncharacterised protein [Opitutae bacterium UBA7350]
MAFVLKFSAFITTLFLVASSGHAELALKWNQTEARSEMHPSAQKTELDFTITNSGDSPVRINRVESSAGNVYIEVDKRIIQPKGKSTVTAIFNKGKRVGKYHEQLKVYLDGRETPISNLHIFVQIPILIDVYPQVLYWAPNSLRKPRTLTVRLDERYIESTDTILYDPMRISITREDDPDKPNVYRLKVLPVNFNIPLRDTIVIQGKDKFGSSRESRIQVTIRPQ